MLLRRLRFPSIGIMPRLKSCTIPTYIEARLNSWAVCVLYVYRDRMDATRPLKGTFHLYATEQALTYPIEAWWGELSG